MQNLSLDITIPVLNEEHRLERGITQTLKFLENSQINHYSITIADNGSEDGTEIIAQKLTRRFPEIRFFKTGEKGVGLALKQSWASSRSDLVGYMDVDLATDLNHLTTAYKMLHEDKIDIVNGSRLLPGSQVINRSLTRDITSVGFNFLLKFVFGTTFTDGMCGFKFVKKDSYEKLTQMGLDNNEWFFCAELLIKAELSGMQIYEVPVRWVDDRDSRVELIKTIGKYSKEIRRLRLEVSRKH